jgi:serine/threonine-protein kinase
VAIKENLDTSPEAQRQFQHEAQILANLSHPNLPRVTDYSSVPGLGQYLIMDFVEGEDLQDMLDRVGALPVAQARAWLDQICEALIYLHEQEPPIIHRDIKPANIKITPKGKAMLVDFGIAKVFDPRFKTTVGARAVTPGYSPPEQYGQGKTDVRSDVYSLGATLYALVTGQMPPESVERVASSAVLVPPSQVTPNVDQSFEEVILRACDVSTMRRYQSVRELQTALR